MFCTKCGSQIPDGVRFCTKCGNPVGNGKPQKITAKPEKKLKPERVPEPKKAPEPKEEPPKKVNPGLMILIVLLTILVIGAAGAAFWYSGGKNLVNELAKKEESTESVQETETEETTAAEESEEAAEVSTEGVQETSTQEETIEGEYVTGRRISETEAGSSYQNAYASTTAAAAAEADTFGMVFPDSDSRYLTESDISGLTAEWMRIARNEIYARHGRLFTDEGLQNYFNQCPWYHGSIPGSSFQESSLNAYELYNRNLIVDYEKKMGY